MQPTRRLSARVLASVTLVVLAACGPGSPVSVSTPTPSSTIVTGQSSPTLADQLHHAAEMDAAARWYQTAAAADAWFTWAASLPPVVVHHAPRPPSGHTGTDPGNLDLSGDRFDRLADCESSMDQNASDGVHLSYFQWLLSTWHSAGGTGDPRDVDYSTQKTIAESWAQRSDPYQQWPHCWPRSAA